MGIFFNQYAPKSKLERFSLCVAALLLCLAGLGIGALGSFLLAASNGSKESGILLGALTVFFFHLKAALSSRLNTFNAIEMSLSGTIFFLGVAADMAYGLLWALIGFLCYIRPFSEGPEPRGWKLLEEKEKLKSRRE